MSEDSGDDKSKGKGKGKGNVSSIAAKRRENEDKIPKGRAIDIVGKHFAGNYLFLEPPNINLHVFDPKADKVVLLEEYEPGVVRIVGKDYVAGAFCRWISEMNGIDPIFNAFGPNDHRQCVDSLIGHAKKLDALPNAFGFKDYGGLCFRRLDFVPTEDDLWASKVPWEDELLVEAFPILDFFRRCSQPEALAAWLGGLFYEGSYRQQYVYMHGPGGCGKSSLLKLLKHIIGSAYHADTLDDCRGRFWTNAFVGKRLVAFPDTNYSKFTATGTIKAITGGDDVRIEIKGGATFSVPLDCRFMFVSNRAPELMDDEATRRRAIIIEAKGLDNSRTIQYEQRILEPAQVKFFVELVMEYYRRACPGHEAIPIDQSKLFDHAEDIDEDIGDFWHSVTCENLAGAISYEDLKEVLWARGIRSRGEVRRHLLWATDNLDVVKKKVNTGNRTSKRVYILGRSWENNLFAAQEKNHSAESACGKLLPIKSTGPVS